MSKTIRRAIPWLWIMTVVACRQDMHNQPKYGPLETSAFFADGRAARPVPAGTIARGELDDTDAFHTGGENGDFLKSIPLPVTTALLHQGEEQFNVYCSPCHDRLGTGSGAVALRGFRAPADLHSERVRSAPPGYIFQVISNGYGGMPDYRDQIPVKERWAIVAFVRALELSRSATLQDVPQDARSRLEAEK